MVTTLYVGDLSKEATENEIMEIFQRAGTVQSVDIPRERISGRSRGFAFVTYADHGHAVAAIEMFNHSRIRGKTVRVSWKVANHVRSEIGNLYVSNLDKTVSSFELHNIFALYGEVVSLRLVEDEAGVSLGYGFVKFSTEESAIGAIFGLHGIVVRGRRLSVSKYIKRSDRQLLGLNKLFVRNLAESVNDVNLSSLFSIFGDVLSTDVIRGKGYGFVSFAQQADAEDAIFALEGRFFEGRRLHISWAKSALQGARRTSNRSEVVIPDLGMGPVTDEYEGGFECL